MVGGLLNGPACDGLDLGANWEANKVKTLGRHSRIANTNVASSEGVTDFTGVRDDICGDTQVVNQEEVWVTSYSVRIDDLNNIVTILSLRESVVVEDSVAGVVEFRMAEGGVYVCDVIKLPLVRPGVEANSHVVGYLAVNSASTKEKITKIANTTFKYILGFVS